MKPTILVAEDHLDIRENLTEFLRMEGFAVLQAVNGLEAYNVAVEERPDLIISDLGMPLWDGMRLLRELRATDELADIPVIILTAWADQGNRRKARQAGATDYVTKPFALAELARVIDQHLPQDPRG